MGIADDRGIPCPGTTRWARNRLERIASRLSRGETQQTVGVWFVIDYCRKTEVWLAILPYLCGRNSESRKCWFDVRKLDPFSCVRDFLEVKNKSGWERMG